jgi:Ca2+-binding EF-hand superfamily protein
MSEEAMDAAEPKFEDLDSLQHDGVATINEVATFALKNGIPWSEAKVLFDIVDQNHDSKITRQEFHDSFPVSESVLEDLHTGFQAIDHDGDHMISHEEWIAYCNGWLAPKLEKATCEDLFATADTQEPKGLIDDAEFKAAGKRCKSVDDGNCSLLAITSRSGGQPHAAASNGLALLRGAKKGQQLRLRGEQLFGTMMRHWKRRRTPGHGGESSIP